MDTSKIKRFAVEARTVLKKGIMSRLRLLGFDADGKIAEDFRLEEISGGAVWRGCIVSESFVRQFWALCSRINQRGMKEVCEEAAYIWFNRLMAIRIVQKNGLAETVLDYDDEARTPHIVNEARRGNFPPMDAKTAGAVSRLMDDDMNITGQFGALITAWCHSNAVIQSCFGGIADWTELLMPLNILSEGGLVDMINHTEFITDEDYRSPELIGWLYQFYISERHDEVYAAKGKFTADEIPAATQIFTPNWIVKYMVQNSLGRIYLDNNPYSADDFKAKWRYLVEPAEPAERDDICRYEELTDLKVADLACGSGHILGECFDLLYDLYIDEGYSRSSAIENIFRHNLIGIDIDTRAKQLATFSLLIKACQKDSAFADAHCMPRVLDMPQGNGSTWKDILGHLVNACQMLIAGDVVEELSAAFRLMDDAHTLGSIMKFDVSDKTREFIKKFLTEVEKRGLYCGESDSPCRCLELILALTDKYHVIVMNPPFMGGGRMCETLSDYVKKNYSEGKADLCTVFVMSAYQHTANKGKYAFIIPPSWLFLSTFETLRRNIIDYQTIDSLLHLSRGIFGADFGSSSCVISNNKNNSSTGIYFRLVERTFQEFEQSHLRMLFEQTLDNHDFRYYFKGYDKDVTELPYSDNGNRIYYPHVLQENFKNIPGCLIGYWLSNAAISLFSEHKLASKYCPKAGLSTGDNKRFLRFWFEIDYREIYFNGECRDDLKSFSETWIPMTKGGTFRKWYGNNKYVLNFKNDGEELKYWLVNNPNDPTTNSYSRYIRNYNKYCDEGISFSDVSCGNPHFRWQNKGFIPNSRGPYIYTSKLELLGFLNSIVPKEVLTLLCPTLTFNVGDIGRLPFKDINDVHIISVVSQNISISRQDWDAHETSWDFKENELVRRITPECDTLEKCLESYKAEWEEKFMQLHANEEELNRQFIEIYGLQDELTPDVPLDEVTILQQGEISIEE